MTSNQFCSGATKNMPDLNLLIDHDDEIQVPIALLTSSLSPAEIVVLLTFLALMKNQKLAEPLALKLNETDLQAVGTSLREKGILKAHMTGRKLSLSVDMHAAIAS